MVEAIITSRSENIESVIGNRSFMLSKQFIALTIVDFVATLCIVLRFGKNTDVARTVFKRKMLFQKLTQN